MHRIQCSDGHLAGAFAYLGLTPRVCRVDLAGCVESPLVAHENGSGHSVLFIVADDPAHCVSYA